MISLLDKAGIGRGEAASLLDSALKGADDGELFVEQRLSEQAVFDDGRLKSASFDEAQGFGLRVVSGETQGYSHSTELSAAAMKRAADICRTIIGSPASAVLEAPGRTNRELYPAKNPADHFAFADKVALLQRVDDFARASDPRIKQVSVALSGDWQEIEILRAHGEIYRDSRPLVRFQVSVMASDGIERASGSYGFGGRGLYGDYLSDAAWQDAVREA
ncbi:MAG TPA: DNA gyrase modulator, partial [Nordella sp.]|nr:DNA gyrase modulator [Nordella sp.]